MTFHTFYIHTRSIEALTPNELALFIIFGTPIETI